MDGGIIEGDLAGDAFLPIEAILVTDLQEFVAGVLPSPSHVSRRRSLGP